MPFPEPEDGQGDLALLVQPGQEKGKQPSVTWERDKVLSCPGGQPVSLRRLGSPGGQRKEHNQMKNRLKKISILFLVFVLAVSWGGAALVTD